MNADLFEIIIVITPVMKLFTRLKMIKSLHSVNLFFKRIGHFFFEEVFLRER
jgi:hypothetical protein